MAKAADMAKVSAKGGFHLLWGLVLSTVIQSIGTIALAYFLSPDSMGIYFIAVSAPNLIANFRDWGMTTAIVRYSAQYNHQNDVAKIRSIFVSGITFELILGLALAIFSIAISDFLAVAFQRPAIAQLIQITSIFILSGGLVNTATAAFTGLERMHLNSVMLIIQSIAKTALMLGLVLIGLGTLGAVVGFSVAVLIAAITGLLLVYTMYRSLPKTTDGKLEILKTTKTLLKYGLPLSVGVILTGFLTAFYNYVLAIFVTDNSLIGNYSVATNFVVLISFFATPVMTMLLPAFSKLDYKKDKQVLKNVFQYSVKYAALIVLPVTIMVMALAQPAVGTIYQDKYVNAPLFLVISSITYLYTALGSLSVGNLINSQGDTKITLNLSILQAAIGFPLSFILISQFGIIGLIATTLIVGIPGLLWSIGFIKKRYGVSIDWAASIRILASSAIAGIITYLFIPWFPFSNPIQLITGAIIFTVAFLLIAILTRTITPNDLANIRLIVDGLGPLRKPISFVLNIIEKLMSKQKTNNTKTSNA